VLLDVTVRYWSPWTGYAEPAPVRRPSMEDSAAGKVGL
jgi:hypothetical protein